jgi:hypothetical protein
MSEQPSLSEAQAQAVEALQAIQDALALEKWALDEPIEGTVLRFRKKDRWHIAMHRPLSETPWEQEDQRWVVTIPDPPGYAILTWAMCKNFIGGAQVEVGTNYRRLPTDKS